MFIPQYLPYIFLASVELAIGVKWIHSKGLKIILRILYIVLIFLWEFMRQLEKFFT